MADKQSGWLSLIQLFEQAETTDRFGELLQVLLTPEEQSTIVKRYQIVQALLQGNKSQRAIAEDLQVSISKITRGSNELKKADKKLIGFLKQCMT